ncbi:glycerophosphoryl diester phosphodiesterase membrane domain-containing protein [Nocardiopsis sp. RSe5-2]|uniref:Glycerophosphoryl diester phosphodiesterase membrane domain-containing protein n=1 Tax=Nocardiopsis endophytica TaxID=3018445 RepID=A0ABT4TZW3_9ACTN|nr:glycerophosphoryl diester phosphodiesterase membrane domain-containing protein [Nocardiopsis endophytica]MDA2810240.1 glycerophosphoryl diester phosphodiesterase membrane domain-containing protein [Nocardiopsis endophytica]
MTHDEGRPGGEPGPEGAPSPGPWAVPGGGGTTPPPQGPAAPPPGFAPPGPAAPPGFAPPGGHAPPGGYPPPGSPPPPPGGYPGHGAPGWGWGPPPVPRPGIIALRPLTLGDIFNGAFTYIRGNPRTVLGIAVLLSAVIALLPSIGSGSMLNDIDRVTAQVDGGGSADAFPFSIGTLVLNAAGLVVQFVGAAVLSGVLAAVVGMAVLGQRPTIREAFTWFAPRTGAVLGVAGLLLLMGVGWFVLFFGALIGGVYVAVEIEPWIGVPIMLGGMLLTVVLGVWVYVRTALAMPAAVLERMGAGRALARSWRLTQRSWWRTFGILLLASLVTQMVASVLATPFSLGGTLGMTLIPDPALAAVVYGATIFLGAVIGGAVTSPFLSGVTGLLYVDLRMRREALDLRLQAAAQEGRGIGPEVYLPEQPSAPPAAGAPGAAPW